LVAALLVSALVINAKKDDIPAETPVPA
jgi:hypothetical protein